jgi:hypothetical protein
LGGSAPARAARAAYRTALLWIEDDPATALAWCLAGMQRHAGIAELPCLAGWCCSRLGRWQDAVWWATLAASLNDASADQERRGFRDVPALYEAPFDLYEAPFDLMRHAARELEDDDLARHAEQRYAEEFLRRAGWRLAATTPASGQTSAPMLRAVLPHPGAPSFDRDR